eukprot:5838836-Prymnesium_polylepis.2
MVKPFVRERTMRLVEKRACRWWHVFSAERKTHHLRSCEPTWSTREKKRRATRTDDDVIKGWG